MFTARAAGGTDYELHGWAWSSNIGWISFNCADEGNCVTGDFKVKYNDSTHLLTGYAWSSSIGAIKFGGLGFAPTGGLSDATMDMTTGGVTGWARACEGTVPGDCSSNVKRADGWDGWIELSGANHPSPQVTGFGGVTIDPFTGHFKGYAWGSDVLGWINFDPGLGFSGPNTGVTCSSNCGGGGGTLPVDCSITSANPNTLGQITSITVNVTSGGTSPYNYQINWGDGNSTNSSNVLTSYSTSHTYASAGPYTINTNVTDSAAKTGSYTCGTQVVNNASSGIDLHIGATVAQANSLQLEVTKGDVFALKWLPIPAGYDCTTVVTKGGNPYLHWVWKPTPGDPGNISNLDTATVPTGQYVFNYSCQNINPPNDIISTPSSVLLRVTSVSEGER